MYSLTGDGMSQKLIELSEITSSASEIDGKVIPIDTIAVLKAKTVTPSTVWVSGYHTKGDGAFGSNIFEWDSTSVEDDNGGTIIKLTSITTGRYKLKFNRDVNVKWFGAKGDGITNDTVAIQKCIDDAYLSYISQYSKILSSKEVVVPKGYEFKVKNLYLKGAITFNCEGLLIPYDSDSDVIRLASSYINIPNLNIESTTIPNYIGRSISLDTSDSTTKSLLDDSSTGSPYYINMGIVRIKNRYDQVNQSTALYINCDSFGYGVSYLKIDDFFSLNSYNGIIFEANNSAGTNGFVNSCTINGKIVNSMVGIKLSASYGEIASNVFNVDIEPRRVANVAGVVNVGGNSNTFNGVIWDWKVSYGYSVYDLGDLNTYSRGYTPLNFPNQVMIAGTLSKSSNTYESQNSIQANYHWSQYARNISGFQDNLLSYADRLYTLVSTPSGNSSKNKYLFSAPESRNWYNQYAIVDSSSVVTITITGIDIWSNCISCGFGNTYAQDIKIEYLNGSSIWVELKHQLDNRSAKFMWSIGVGDGYNMKGIRYTFTKAFNKSNLVDLVYVSNGLLDVGFLAAFGMGARKSYIKNFDNNFIGMLSVTSSSVPNISMFVDSADGKMKFKDSTGTVNVLY